VSAKLKEIVAMKIGFIISFFHLDEKRLQIYFCA